MPRSVLEIIDRMARDEAMLRGQEFLAPLTRGARARLRVRGLVYELAVAGAAPGWWRCVAQDARQAQVLGEALPWQRGEYLALWPSLRLVLLEALKGGDWLALPYNPSDALQRFGLAGPLVARLVEGGQPFERVVGRVEGQAIWYDAPDRRADPAQAEALRAALAEGHALPGVAGLGAGEQAAYALLAAHTAEHAVETRLRAALTLGGARLIGYELAGDQLRVTWERAGQRSVTLIAPDMTVVSAGVCLSGEERRFDLASIVGVVREAPAFARYDD
jgi:hypothetical protein